MDPSIHILVPVFLACVINAWIYSTGLQKGASKTPGLPPGYVVGIVWIVLFAMLGYAHYLLRKIGSPASWGIVALISLCLLYPFITGLKRREGKTWDQISLLVGLLVAFWAMQWSMEAFYWIVPYLLWVAYVRGFYRWGKPHR